MNTVVILMIVFVLLAALVQGIRALFRKLSPPKPPRHDPLPATPVPTEVEKLEAAIENTQRLEDIHAQLIGPIQKRLEDWKKQAAELERSHEQRFQEYRYRLALAGPIDEQEVRQDYLAQYGASQRAESDRMQAVFVQLRKEGDVAIAEFERRKAEIGRQWQERFEPPKVIPLRKETPEQEARRLAAGAAYEKKRDRHKPIADRNRVFREFQNQLWQQGVRDEDEVHARFAREHADLIRAAKAIEDEIERELLAAKRKAKFRKWLPW